MPFLLCITYTVKWCHLSMIYDIWDKWTVDLVFYCYHTIQKTPCHKVNLNRKYLSVLSHHYPTLQLNSHVYQRFHKVRPEARSTSLSQNTPSKSAAYTLYDSWPLAAIMTGDLVAPLFDPTPSTARTTSIPSTTEPNTQCFPSSQAVSAVQRKNCNIDRWLGTTEEKRDVRGTCMCVFINWGFRHVWNEWQIRTWLPLVLGL